uniref:Uncharacterized protein n=1 Tax=Setaria viridis TaxID=4556 RepID=A0A4U6VQS0_SETVI|nr:hypothetical protein SEVIR_2G088675v2 [Setaria viridis]
MLCRVSKNTQQIFLEKKNTGRRPPRWPPRRLARCHPPRHHIRPGGEGPPPERRRGGLDGGRRGGRAAAGEKGRGPRWGKGRGPRRGKQGWQRCCWREGEGASPEKRGGGLAGGRRGGRATAGFGQEGRVAPSLGREEGRGWGGAPAGEVEGGREGAAATAGRGREGAGVARRNRRGCRAGARRKERVLGSGGPGTG